MSINSRPSIGKPVLAKHEARLRAVQQETTPRKQIDPVLAENEAIRKEIEGNLDHLNQLWDAVEKKIVGMQPPRHIECYCYGEVFSEFDPNSLDHHLGLQRHGGKWRICYAARDSRDDSGEMDWRPITDCSTEIRVQMGKFVEKLKKEVVRSGKAFIPTIKEAIQSLENLLADI